MGMIFVRKSIHLSTSIFVSIIFNHSNAEFVISHESVMDTLKELLLALLLLQLVGNILFPVSRFLTISMSVRSSFLDDVVGNGKEVHRVLDEFLIFLSSFTLFSLYLLRMTKKMDYFLRNFIRRERECFPGSISIQFVVFIGMILGE